MGFITPFNIKIRFNSRALLGFFVFSAIGFVLLLLTIWSHSIKSERSANLNHDVDVIVYDLVGDIVESSDLTSQGLPNLSESLIQKYLDYTFANKNSPTNRISSVEIYLLKPKIQLVGKWDSPDLIPPRCLEKRSKYIQTHKSKYHYIINLTINTCSYTMLNRLEDSSHTTQILVALTIILIWGIFILALLRSVRYASRLLADTEDASEVIEKSENILWSDVRILAQKALQVRGRNLQYYQTLILDAQHDVAKTVDLMLYDSSPQKMAQNISVIRTIMQRLTTEITSTGAPLQDVSARRELTASDMMKFIQIYFSSCTLDNQMPENCVIPINDISIFERILVNIASNATKHGVGASNLKIIFAAQTLSISVLSTVSTLSAWALFLAKLTKRIDTKRPEVPVYGKIFGRVGRGLSIIKRGILKLNGEMIFEINKNTINIGLRLPAFLSSENLNVPLEQAPKRRKVMFFRDHELFRYALSLGFDSFFVTETELNRLISSGDPLDIVSDVEFEINQNSTARLITKKERLNGLAINWLKESIHD